MSHNLSYLQYGDFATELGNRELVSYSRTFTGVSGSIKEKYTDIRLFASSTDQSIQVDEIPGEGISGLYYLCAARLGIRIVEGSERVYIQVRDRLHPESVLREDIQYRFTDYDISYDGGTLRFKRPVPFLTPDENPVVILVTYETARALKKQRVGGGRAGFKPYKTFYMGATVIGEERTNADFWLTGLDAEWRAKKSRVYLRNRPYLGRTAQTHLRHRGYTGRLGMEDRRARKSKGTAGLRSLLPGCGPEF